MVHNVTALTVLEGALFSCILVPLLALSAFLGLGGALDPIHPPRGGNAPTIFGSRICAASLTTKTVRQYGGVLYAGKCFVLTGRYYVERRFVLACHDFVLPC